MSSHILIVEDDDSLREILAFNIELFGYEVSAAKNAQEASRMIETTNFNLLLLDVMLPGGCGLQLCRLARNKYPQTNILMLTSLDDEQDKIQGLEMGADDYLTKPFSLRELQARIKARLRREQTAEAKQEPVFEFDNFYLHLSKRVLRIAGKNINLTAKEFDLLAKLVQKPDQVFSRDQLLADIWGYDFGGYEHTVNTHINRLRKKLAPLDCVQTVWGVGYKFVEPEPMITSGSE